VGASPTAIGEPGMSDDTGPGGPGRVPSGLYTETLARLYWQQGFLAKALDIYRHLVQAQPGNQQLWEQIAALERQLAAAALSAAEAQHSVSPAGPTAVARPGPVGPVEPTERVVAHLERWLQHLRRQRMG
jgi:hypothetical protein